MRIAHLFQPLHITFKSLRECNLIIQVQQQGLLLQSLHLLFLSAVQMWHSQMSGQYVRTSAATILLALQSLTSHGHWPGLMCWKRFCITVHPACQLFKGVGRRPSWWQHISWTLGNVLLSSFRQRAQSAVSPHTGLPNFIFLYGMIDDNDGSNLQLMWFSTQIYALHYYLTLSCRVPIKLKGPLGRVQSANHSHLPVWKECQCLCDF